MGNELQRRKPDVVNVKVRRRQPSAVEIRATALYVPAGIDPKVLKVCADDIKQYNDSRGIHTDWYLPRRQLT